MANILVIAPHADDEVLGVGGTIAKLVDEGNDVYVAVMTVPEPPDFSPELAPQIRAEALHSHKLLGVKDTLFLRLPAARLDVTPHKIANQKLCEVFDQIRPHTVFIPFLGDIHLDHQYSALSALVASRPHQPFAPRVVYAYETLSETNWNAPYVTPAFVPNTYIDISPYLERKIEAMKAYASQIQSFPHERSEEALRALATLRGSTVSCFAAEAFVLHRQILK